MAECNNNRKNIRTTLSRRDVTGEAGTRNKGKVKLFTTVISCTSGNKVTEALPISPGSDVTQTHALEKVTDIC